MNILKWVAVFLLVVFLTMLTQVGGVIYLGCMPLFAKNRTWIAQTWIRRLANAAIFAAIYLVITFFVVPDLALALNGRIPLPDNNALQPASQWYRIFNRTYVRPALASILDNAATNVYNRSPGSLAVYMDANFPFFDHFAMPLHLGHNDGRSVDVGFYYLDVESGKPTPDRPSMTGYGVFESPKGGEPMSTEYCQKKGFGNYDMTKFLAIGFNKSDYRFDPLRTEALLRNILRDDRVQSILIEGHLQHRLHLENIPKVKNPDCYTVRHDDHFHVTLR